MIYLITVLLYCPSGIDEKYVELVHDRAMPIEEPIVWDLYQLHLERVGRYDVYNPGCICKDVRVYTLADPGGELPDSLYP